EKENDQRKSFLEKVCEVLREGDAGLFDVIDYRRQYAASRMVLKKSDGLAKNFGKHAIAQIGGRGMSDILNLRGAQIFRNALGDKNYQQRNTENRPYVMEVRGREEPVQINCATAGQGQQRQQRTWRGGSKYIVNGQSNHQGHGALGQSNKRHQTHAEDQPYAVGTHVDQQPL